MAIAMLETEHMLADYIYGDGKTGDAANFGIFKQNWLMIRSSWSPFVTLGAADYNRGAALNTSLSLDIQVLHASQANYGNLWWAGHRNGATGLGTPGTLDIALYREAVTWIENQMSSNSAHLTDDIRFWVAIPAI
jgi:hypothetical protein